ncbi:hypothetical protein [Orenia marismortui]|uniref:hypothetical protein n=1 Tax=Orenia marismortui TaxID=46469 RepID=UPI00036A0CAA|nr:hypothetical protein [Orenia marismortui]
MFISSIIYWIPALNGFIGNWRIIIIIIFASLMGALLFPKILYSTESILTAILGGFFASILIIKKQNMIITVGGAILLVYILNSYI